jgi:hypothetical protein
MSATLLASKVFFSSTVWLNLFYWTIAFAPSLPYVLLYAGYRSSLFQKRDALANLMAQKGVFDSYQSRFGQARDKRDEIVAELFNLYYRASTYWLAIGLNAVVITLGVAVGLMRVGVPIWLPSGIASLVKSAPLTLGLGFAGAYVLSLYDTLRRCRTADLSAYSLHFTWVHMVLASILAPLVCQAFQPAVAAPIAFGIGLFPIKDTVDFVRQTTKKRLELSVTADAAKVIPLSLVQGLNNEAIDRLEEEGISTTVQLAYSDPIKLFFKTNFQWAWVIDVIDQAILINYVGEKIETLRPVGIRGAIEMTVLGESMRARGSVQERANQVVTIVAQRLGVSEAEARNLGDNLYEDGQVDLIWQLYKPYEEPSKFDEPPPAGGESATLPPPRRTQLPLNQQLTSEGGSTSEPQTTLK